MKRNYSELEFNDEQLASECEYKHSCVISFRVGEAFQEHIEVRWIRTNMETRDSVLCGDILLDPDEAMALRSFINTHLANNPTETAP